MAKRGARRSRILIALILALSSVAALRAEVKLLKVDPKQTDAAIATIHGPHIAMYDPAATSNHRLLLYFGGTGAPAASGARIARTFAGIGYHVISLDYDNTVQAASCVKSSDSSCFDKYRAAIVSGGAGSDKVNVTADNSILNRFQKLLAYLAANNPDEGWDEFLKSGSPVWEHIVTAGHSQGSGHAAYIAKLYAVDRVLMFSGPQDYLNSFDKPAPWESRPGATPPGRFYAFLNIHDPFNESHQVESCKALMNLKKAEPFMVEPGKEIQGDHHILTTDVDAAHAHGTTVSPQFENVWIYLGLVK